MTCTFTSGLLIGSAKPADVHGLQLAHTQDLYLIGRLDEDFVDAAQTIPAGTAFWLSYRTLPTAGLSQWDCPVHLGEKLRRRILDVVRKTIREPLTSGDPTTLPDFIACHDLRTLPRDVAMRQAETLSMEFFKTKWQREVLGIREEDWVVLNVPYSEKDQAKALGAKWDAQGRTWRVQRQEDMRPFARWAQEAGVALTTRPDRPRMI